MEFGIFLNGYLPGPASRDSDCEHEMLMRELEYGIVADKYNWKYAWLGEHHALTEYSHLSAPEVLMGYLARATERIHVGTGINNLSLSQQQTQTMVPEGIFDLTKVLEKDKPERPVIVLLALEKQQASAEQPQNVLNQLARSGAMMYVVSMEGGSASSGTSGIGRASADNGAMDMAGRAQVMGDGPKQSGGRRVEVAALTAFPTGIQQIADDLSSQYLIKYTLPDGVKPSDRLNVSLKKKGATLRAPTKISSK